MIIIRCVPLLGDLAGKLGIEGQNFRLDSLFLDGFYEDLGIFSTPVFHDLLTNTQLESSMPLGMRNMILFRAQQFDKWVKETPNFESEVKFMIFSSPDVVLGILDPVSSHNCLNPRQRSTIFLSSSKMESWMELGLQLRPFAESYWLELILSELVFICGSTALTDNCWREQSNDLYVQIEHFVKDEAVFEVDNDMHALTETVFPVQNRMERERNFMLFVGKQAINFPKLEQPCPRSS